MVILSFSVFIELLPVKDCKNTYKMLNNKNVDGICLLYIRWLGKKLVPLHPKSAQYQWGSYVKLSNNKQYNKLKTNNYAYNFTIGKKRQKGAR